MTDKTTTTTIPAGWKLVPIEPTHEMMRAAHKPVGNALYDNPFMDTSKGWGERGAEVYRAMLCAAPSPAPAAPSAAQPDALADEREFNGQLLAMLKKMFDAPTMAAGYAILADFAAQFYPGTPVALRDAQGGSVTDVEECAAVADRFAAQTEDEFEAAAARDIAAGIRALSAARAAQPVGEVVGMPPAVAEVTEAAARYTKREGTDFIGRMGEAFGEIDGCLEGGEVPADMLEGYRSAASDLAALSLAQMIMADEQIAALRSGEAAHAGELVVPDQSDIDAEADRLFGYDAGEEPAQRPPPPPPRRRHALSPAATIPLPLATGAGHLPARWKSLPRRIAAATAGRTS